MLLKLEGKILVRIDWAEYKEHKKMSIRENKLEIILEFFKSYYNMTNPSDMYESLRADDIGQMMLDKYDVKSDIDLENILFKM